MNDWQCLLLIEKTAGKIWKRSPQCIDWIKKKKCFKKVAMKCSIGAWWLLLEKLFIDRKIKQMSPLFLKIQSAGYRWLENNDALKTILFTIASRGYDEVNNLII